MNVFFFSTVSMRSGKLLTDIEFETIILDEAAQCPETLVWGLLRKKVTKLFLAGDPLQLPALVSEKGRDLEFGRSMMERLMKIGVPSELLNVQRRMHPDIAAFSDKFYYDNKLETEYNYNLIPKVIKPLDIINIEGKEEKIGTSFQNEIEANKVIELFNELKEIDNINNIVVISPYQAQCNFLKKISHNINLDVHTLDSFQGREADAIILTTVRTGNSVGFWNDPRRLNVGLTRAKHVLRVIGRISTWIHEPGPLKDFYEFYNKA